MLDHAALIEQSKKVIDRAYDEIAIGEKASFKRTITNEDVLNFASLSGDVNPIHIDDEFAKETFFKERIAHGMLSASFISTLIGTIFPGKNVIYLSQNCKFLKPVRINDTLTVVAEVIDKRPEKRIMTLQTNVYNQNDEMVIEGNAVIMKK